MCSLIAALRLLTMDASRLQSLETALSQLLPRRDADVAATMALLHGEAGGVEDAPEVVQARGMLDASGVGSLPPYVALNVCRRRADVLPTTRVDEMSSE